MSADVKKKKGFEPIGPLPAISEKQEAPPDPTQNMRAWLQMFTDFNAQIAAQNQQQAKHFKDLFDQSSLPKYVKIAGVSALLAFLLELARMIWLILRYEMKF
jgi:hypothetical protein